MMDTLPASAAMLLQRTQSFEPSPNAPVAEAKPRAALEAAINAVLAGAATGESHD